MCLAPWPLHHFVNKFHNNGSLKGTSLEFLVTALENIMLWKLLSQFQKFIYLNIDNTINLDQDLSEIV